MTIETQTSGKRRLLILATIVLWLLTGVLGVLGSIVLRALILRNYARFDPTGQALGAINIIFTIPIAILLIGVLVGGAEYHRIHFGRPKSWRAFSQTLAIELSILVLPVFI